MLLYSVLIGDSASLNIILIPCQLNPGYTAFYTCKPHIIAEGRTIKSTIRNLKRLVKEAERHENKII